MFPRLGRLHDDTPWDEEKVAVGKSIIKCLSQESPPVCSSSLLLLHAGWWTRKAINNSIKKIKCTYHITSRRKNKFEVLLCSWSIIAVFVVTFNFTIGNVGLAAVELSNWGTRWQICMLHVKCWDTFWVPACLSATWQMNSLKAVWVFSIAAIHTRSGVCRWGACKIPVIANYCMCTSMEREKIMCQLAIDGETRRVHVWLGFTGCLCVARLSWWSLNVTAICFLLIVAIDTTDTLFVTEEQREVL